MPRSGAKKGAFTAKRFGEVGAQNFDRDVAPMLAIVREVDGGHPTAAEFTVETVSVGEGVGEARRRESSDQPRD